MATIIENKIHLSGDRDVLIPVQADNEEIVQISAVPEDEEARLHYAEFVIEVVLKPGTTDVVMSLPVLTGFNDTKWRFGVHDSSEAILSEEVPWGVTYSLPQQHVRD